MVDIDEVCKLLNKKIKECKQENYGCELKKSDVELQMARLQKVDEILRKPLICFEPTYFIKDCMIPCTDPDMAWSCPVSNLEYLEDLEGIDKVTDLAQDGLLSSMGEFVLPWKYFNREKSLLTVQPFRFTLETWYDHLFRADCQDSWISFHKIRLYPLLRLCTKWLKYAFEHKMCHGDLMHNIFFETDTKPQLLIRSGSGSYKTDLETIKYFLFVIINRMPPKELRKTQEELQKTLEELQRVNKSFYSEFNKDVPCYLSDFLRLLDNFDEQKHSVDVVFNPSFLWSIEKKFKHLDEAFIFFIKESRLHEIKKHLWWRWFKDFEKLPDDHPLKKILTLAGSQCTLVLEKSGNGNPNYKNNAQLLRLFRNTRCHVTEMLFGYGWTQDVVLEQFEEKFNILSKLSQTCNKYAMDLPKFAMDLRGQSRRGFLKRLGYIAP